MFTMKRLLRVLQNKQKNHNQNHDHDHHLVTLLHRAPQRQLAAAVVELAVELTKKMKTNYASFVSNIPATPFSSVDIDAVKRVLTKLTIATFVV